MSRVGPSCGTLLRGGEGEHVYIFVMLIQLDRIENDKEPPMSKSWKSSVTKLVVFKPGHVWWYSNLDTYGLSITSHAL